MRKAKFILRYRDRITSYHNRFGSGPAYTPWITAGKFDSQAEAEASRKFKWLRYRECHVKITHRGEAIWNRTSDRIETA